MVYSSPDNTNKFRNKTAILMPIYYFYTAKTVSKVLLGEFAGQVGPPASPPPVSNNSKGKVGNISIYLTYSSTSVRF